MTSGTSVLLRTLIAQLMAVTITYLVVGAALAAVPLFVARDLSQGAAAIGVITGAQFLVGVVMRIYAGGFADRHGPKRAILVGLLLTVAASAINFGAFLFRDNLTVTLGALIVGRVILGAGEGFVMVGGQTWSLAEAGPKRSGLVIGWVGTAMFGAMALGAPLGGGLYALGGFGAVAVVTTLTPVPVLMLLMRKPGAQAVSGQAIRLLEVLRRMMGPCIAMALIGFSYGTILSFGVLLFEERGWRPTWIGLTLFSSALVVARVTAGSVPDRFGGRLTALWSLVVMVAGFVTMGLTAFEWMAWGGAFVAGMGYALVYPSITREGLRNVPDRNRGSAMALTASSVALSLGLGSPLLGLMAEATSTAMVFLFAAAMAVLAMGVVARTPVPADP